MSDKKIIIDISSLGETIIRVEGVRGEDCQSLTRNIESALGVISKTTLTDDFYERPLTNEVHIAN